MESVVLIFALGYDWFLRTFLVYYKVRISTWAGPEFANAMVYCGGLFFFAPMIYVFASSRGVWGWLASRKSLVYLGEISFAFYMIHNILLKQIFDHWYAGSRMDPNLAFFASLCLSLGVSSLLFQLVEIPAKKFLVALYEWSFLSAFRSVWDNGVQFVKSPFVFLIGISIVVPVFFFTSQHRWDRAQPAVEQIVNRTPPAMRDLKWETGIVLAGWSLEPRRGGIQLNLVWRKELEPLQANPKPQVKKSVSKMNARRVFFLVEKEGVRKPVFQKNAFMRRGLRNHDLLVERLFLPHHRIQNTERIELAIELKREPKGGTGGPEIQSNSRPLVLVNSKRLAKFKTP